MLDFNLYSQKFRHAARSLGLPNDYISNCLSYAATLADNKVPIIYDIHHFSRLVGYQKSYIEDVINDNSHFYHHFKVLKKSKKSYRFLCEPYPDLKAIQRWILENILKTIALNPCAKAYVRNSSIYDSARLHIDQGVLIRVDIKDFFDSITFEHVFPVFEKLGYSREVSLCLTRLCLYKNRIPQGGVTSPFLSNIVFKRIDSRVFGLCQKYGARYSRYADDLVFSGTLSKKEVKAFLWSLEHILRSEGFSINHKKTSIQRKQQRQLVHGLVVNNKLNLPRAKVQALRQELYYVMKFGVANCCDHNDIQRSHYIDHLIGRVNQVLYVQPSNRYFIKALNYLRECKRINLF